MEDYNLDDMQLANPSVLNSQQEDVKTALEVLEAMQDDLSSEAPNWAEMNIEATVELIKEWKGVR